MNEIELGTSLLEPGPITSVVEMQIQRRIAVFEEWINNKSIPIDLLQGLPSSITSLRLWEVPNLGILRSTDPNAWTRGHLRWGWRVVKAEKLLAKVHGLIVVPRQKETASDTVVRLRAKLRELRHLLQKQLDQWQVTQEAVVSAKRDAGYHKARANALEEQLQAYKTALERRESELAEVRRDLLLLQGMPRIASK